MRGRRPSRSRRAALIGKVRAAWPDRALTHGRGYPAPPVRDGGNTAALIDLAVQVTLDEVREQLASIPMSSSRRRAIRSVLEQLGAS